MKTASVREKRSEKQEQRAGRRSWVAVILVSMAVFLDAVDVSIVNVALPMIKHDLQLTTTELQWVPGVYLLTYTCKLCFTPPPLMRVLLCYQQPLQPSRFPSLSHPGS